VTLNFICFARVQLREVHLLAVCWYCVNLCQLPCVTCARGAVFLYAVSVYSSLCACLLAVTASVWQTDPGRA